MSLASAPSRSGCGKEGLPEPSRWGTLDAAMGALGALGAMALAVVLALSIAWAPAQPTTTASAEGRAPTWAPAPSGLPGASDKTMPAWAVSSTTGTTRARDKLATLWSATKVTPRDWVQKARHSSAPRLLQLQFVFSRGLTAVMATAVVTPLAVTVARLGQGHFGGVDCSGTALGAGDSYLGVSDYVAKNR